MIDKLYCLAWPFSIGTCTLCMTMVIYWIHDIDNVATVSIVNYLSAPVTVISGSINSYYATVVVMVINDE